MLGRFLPGLVTSQSTTVQAALPSSTPAPESSIKPLPGTRAISYQSRVRVRGLWPGLTKRQVTELVGTKLDLVSFEGEQVDWIGGPSMTINGKSIERGDLLSVHEMDAKLQSAGWRFVRNLGNDDDNWETWRIYRLPEQPTWDLNVIWRSPDLKRPKAFDWVMLSSFNQH